MRKIGDIIKEILEDIKPEETDLRAMVVPEVNEKITKKGMYESASYKKE